MVALGTATQFAAQLVGLGGLAGGVAAVVAVAYRWYVRERVPRGLALLFGLAAVAVYLNTTTALGQAIAGSGDAATVRAALFNIVAFGSGTGGALLGRRAGDRFAVEVVTGGEEAVDGGVGRLVRTVGRAIRVDLPEDVGDVVGYDPVPRETKKQLAGKTFVFPRGLTVTQLRDRLVERLKTDYAVGHVDIEVTEAGTVEYLAVGARAAGVGPTLPPATRAVAVRADPALAASAGDTVQVWEPDPMERVLTAELRGTSGDVATLAVDAADAPKLDPDTSYRLVTLPTDDRPDREFVSLLRAARETFSSVTVAADSPLGGLPVGALSLVVVAVEPSEGGTVTLPERDHTLAAGDTLFAIASPETLRRLERAADPGPGAGPGRGAEPGSDAGETVAAADRSDPE
jgi:hypothetical protein